MNLNWSNRVIKYVLFIFNLLFVISGIIMIAVGVSVKSYYTDYDIFLSSNYFSLPNLLIATGSLIFFISFFGCCGAIKESWFMIFIFSILLTLIFILEFSAGIAGYVLRDKTSAYLTDELLGSMQYYQFNSKDPNGITHMWDSIQYEFHCCGAEGPKDWQSVYHPTTTIPSENSSSTIVTVTAKPTTITTNATETTVAGATTPTTVSNASSAPTVPTTAPNKTETTVISGPTAAAQISAVVEIDPKFNLPATCCKFNAGATGTVTCNLNDNSTASVYGEGCVSAFGDYLKDHAVTLGGVGIAIAIVQLFGVIFACHLAKQLKHGFYST